MNKETRSEKEIVLDEIFNNDPYGLLDIEEDKVSSLKECQEDYKIVIDGNGKRYTVKRGKEFLNLMMRLQAKGLA